MSLERYRDYVGNIGKAATNALFPNDFEIYMFGLELVDSLGATVEYFVFPVNPKDIRETNTALVNVKKTAGGVTTISTQTFVPTDITLTGNFGRQFKFLMQKDVVSFSALSFTDQPSKLSFNPREFSPTVKTGYGCIKILERIYNKAHSLNSNDKKPYSLYFYNLALGNSYLVKPISLTMTQNQSENMIWDYTLQLKSLSKIEDVATNVDQQSLSLSLSSNNAIQKAGNKTLSDVKRALKSISR